MGCLIYFYRIHPYRGRRNTSWLWIPTVATRILILFAAYYCAGGDKCSNRASPVIILETGFGV